MSIYIYLLESFTALFAIVSGLIRWQTMQIGFRLVLLQLFVACAVELVGKLLSERSINNQALFNFYLLVEIWLLVGAGRIFFTDRIHKLFCLICLVLGTIAWVVYFSFYSIDVFAFPLLILDCFLQSAVYLLLLFPFTIQAQEYENRNAVLWLIIGTLIYFSGNIPLFAILVFLERKSALAVTSFNLNIMLLCVRYVFTGIAFSHCVTKHHKYV